MQPEKRRLAVLFSALIALPMRVASSVVMGALAGFASHPALAQAPRPWEIGMQPAFSPMKRGIIDLHNLVLVLITIITVFVAGLIAWVCYRYNEKRNPVASPTSHHTGLEIAWTLIPAAILVIMAIPSFRLIYYLDRTPEPDMTIKVTGHQWYWEYSYPDNGNVDVESRYIHDEDLKPGQLRLLDVDNQLVIPVGKKIRILTNSADVIHSFFIPSLGAQRYAIPGRTIEMWLMAEKPGVYYGECNQICGQDHNKMAIAVHAVTEAEFNTWIEQAKKAASNGSAQTRVLAAVDRSSVGNTAPGASPDTEQSAPGTIERSVAQIFQRRAPEDKGRTAAYEVQR